MASPRDVVVRFLADARGFLTGTDDIERAYEDMARDADTAADAGEDSARRLARAYDRAGQEIRRDTDATGRDIKQDLGDTGKEAGQEFATNLGSSLASGDSSRIVQDSAGGLIGSLALAGPVGIAVAAGASIALSMWNAFEEKTRKRAEAVRAVAGEVYQGLLDDAKTFADEYGQTVVKAFFDPQNEDELATKARKAGKVLKVNVGEALAGGPASIAALAQTARARVDELATQSSKARSAIAAQRLNQEKTYFQDILDYLDTIETGWKDAESAVKDYQAATKSAAQYAAKGSSYAPGGSMYRSQVPNGGRYAGGKRGGKAD